MKKLILVLFLVFAIFVVYNRQRLYLRDPFATVTVNDVVQNGVQVYINYSSDVMMIRESVPSFWTVVQHDNHVGTPVAMKGLHWIAYLSDADVVPLVAADANARVIAMSGKSVVYQDGKNATVVLLH